VLIVVFLLFTVLLRVGLVAAVVYIMLPVTRACPRCAAELTSIRHPLLRYLLPNVEHRWCLTCGWNGVTRRMRARPSGQSRVISRAARS
jgi:hypothetical protein